MTFLIRPVTPEDAPGYNFALDSVARERLYLRLTEAPPLQNSLAFIEGNLATGNPHVVALDGNVLVGWCDICRSGDQDSKHCGWLGMGIIASHRGRGIGSALLGAAIQAAKSSFGRIELEVYSANTTAIALYEKSGFQHEGRRRRAQLRDDVYDDIVMMGLVF